MNITIGRVVNLSRYPPENPIKPAQKLRQIPNHPKIIRIKVVYMCPTACQCWFASVYVQSYRGLIGEPQKDVENCQNSYGGKEQPANENRPVPDYIEWVSGVILATLVLIEISEELLVVIADQEELEISDLWRWLRNLVRNKTIA